MRQREKEGKTKTTKTTKKIQPPTKQKNKKRNAYFDATNAREATTLFFHYFSSSNKQIKKQNK